MAEYDWNTDSGDEDHAAKLDPESRAAIEEDLEMLKYMLGRVREGLRVMSPMIESIIKIWQGIADELLEDSQDDGSDGLEMTED